MSVLRSPRLVAVLLWLALALLPLRGLAAGLMAGPAAGHAAATAPADVPMPCHEQAGHHDAMDGGAHHDAAAMHADSADDAADEGSAAVADDCPTCALCALCHGGFAHASALPLVLAAPEAGAPAAATTVRLAPHTPDGLFRPPRPLLA